MIAQKLRCSFLLGRDRFGTSGVSESISFEPLTFGTRNEVISPTSSSESMRTMLGSSCLRVPALLRTWRPCL